MYYNFGMRGQKNQKICCLKQMWLLILDALQSSRHWLSFRNHNPFGEIAIGWLTQPANWKWNQTKNQKVCEGNRMRLWLFMLFSPHSTDYPLEVKNHRELKQLDDWLNQLIGNKTRQKIKKYVKAIKCNLTQTFVVFIS